MVETSDKLHPLLAGLTALFLSLILAVAAFLVFGYAGSTRAVHALAPSATPAAPRSSARELARETLTMNTAPAVAVPTAGAPMTPAVVPTTTTPPTLVTETAAASQPAGPSVAELVSQVEAAGIEPGSNWSWTFGDTATQCGVISGAGTGCTFGTDGLEHTVFAGSPNLTLVAHEMANAETQNDAIPSLLTEVAAAEAGTSWSATDAVASCLVAHFMGFQDNAAGTWVCPAPLATVVADNIHDTL